MPMSYGPSDPMKGAPMVAQGQAGFGKFMLNQLQNLAEQTKIDKPLNKDKMN
jgi:hypothetical protein